MSVDLPPPLRVRGASGSPNFIPVFEMVISGATLTRTSPLAAQLLIDSGVAARVITAGSGLSGGGDLSADRVFSVNTNVRDKTAGFFAGGNLTTVHLAEESRIRVPFNMQAIRADLAVTTSASGASIIVNLKQYNGLVAAGTSMFAVQADEPFIPALFMAGSATSFTAIGTLYAGSFLGFDIDQVGSVVAGSNLTITLVARSS